LEQCFARRHSVEEALQEQRHHFGGSSSKTGISVPIAPEALLSRTTVLMKGDSASVLNRAVLQPLKNIRGS